MSIRVKITRSLPAGADVLISPVFSSEVDRLSEAAELERLGFKGGWGAAELVVPRRRDRAIFAAAVGLGAWEPPSKLLGEPSASAPRRARDTFE